MKKSLLLAVAALTPLTLFAQDPTLAPGGGLDPNAPATVAPVTSPAAPRLSEVQFSGSALSEVVEALQKMAKKAGVDSATEPLNIVISPGLEDLAVPALSLRNVTPTEVLSVATTVLGLRMEPVMADDVAGGNTGENRVVAWLIKRQEAAADPFGGGGNTAAPPPATSTAPPTNSSYPGPYGLPGGPNPPGILAPAANGAAIGGGGFTVPAPVAIAGSPPAITSTPAPVPLVRVFGIGPLLSVSPLQDANERAKERASKFDRLIHTLNRLSNDQSIKTDIAAYEEMDIIVVKCADSTGMELIAEAIEAMKSNVEPARAQTPQAGGGGGTGSGLRRN